MMFGYYNDACSNEIHLLIALGRGIESVKMVPSGNGASIHREYFLLLVHTLGCRWHYQLLCSNVIHSTTRSAAIKYVFYICQWIPHKGLGELPESLQHHWLCLHPSKISGPLALSWRGWTHWHYTDKDVGCVVDGLTLCSTWSTAYHGQSDRSGNRHCAVWWQPLVSMLVVVHFLLMVMWKNAKLHNRSVHCW
jgi:hypothetical protein